MGQKMGAHYNGLADTACMPRLSWPRRPARALLRRQLAAAAGAIAAAAVLGLAAAAGPAKAANKRTHRAPSRPAATSGGTAARQAQAESDLKAVRAAIARVRAQVNKDQIERDRLSRDLRTAETAVGDARSELEKLREERNAQAERRAALSRERSDEEKSLESERAALAAQVRAAYRMGPQESLRLLLNQGDPGRTARLFQYYGYFSRARAARISTINQHLTRINELDQSLAEEETRLRELEASQKSQVAHLDEARASRAAVLSRLEAESRDRQQRLERMRKQQAGLESLIAQLAKALEKYPVFGNDAFAKLRGKLSWPVSGKLVARFGETRAGGVKWDGVLVSTERGAAVHAVYSGRVAYADWLPGLGLLAIVDHGNGYLSLYGHNERLFKSAGEQVTAGDTIASAGDSGGGGRPELYFEIRRAGKPVDPRPWFRVAEPR